MNIKLSQLTQEEITERRRTTITTKGRTIIIKDKRSLKKILPTFDATLVMRRDITPEIVQEIKAPSIRSQIGRYIINMSEMSHLTR